MAMSFLSITTAAASSSPLLPIRRLSGHKPTTTAVSFPLKPQPLRLSTIHSSSSSSSPRNRLLSPIASASRTLLFLLLASLLSLSGLRPLPSLASPPPPTHQPQEQEEPQQSKQPEAEEEEEGVEVEVEAEEAWRQPDEEEEEGVEEEVEEAWRQPDEEEDGDGEEEVEMYVEVLRRDPGDVDALKCVLFAKMRRTDWDGALGHARRLREAEPGEVEWRLMEALLHDLKGDLAAAERLFRDLLAEQPLLLRALHGLALCMHKRSEGPSVFEMLEKALQLAISEERVPEERNIKLLIAQMHVVKGQLDVASEKLQNLINEDPRDFRPHLCQGIVYALLEKKKEADEQFDTYRSLVPDEFPDKSFINDVILAAKMESKDRLQKEFGSGFLSKK